MKRITLDEKWEIGCEMLYKYDELVEAEVDYPVVTVITKYDVAKNLIEYLIESEYEIDSVQISNPYHYGYDKEYAVMIDEDGVSCVPLWHEKNELHDAGYYVSGGDYVFVDEDCNSAILEYIDADKKDVVEFGIDDEEECDGDCENCYHQDDDIVAMINGRKASKEEAEAIVRDALISYCSIMDDINETLSHSHRYWF